MVSVSLSVIDLIHRFLYLHPILRPIARRAVKWQRERLEKTEGRWGGRAGFLYDLEHRLMSRSQISYFFDIHYRHTITAVDSIVESFRPATIVDYGCGPGLLTEALAHRFPECEVIGTDLRTQSLRLNARLAPQVRWAHIDELPETPKPILFVLDGVANYMSEGEMLALLGDADSFLVCYFAREADPMIPTISGFSFQELARAAGRKAELRYESEIHAVVCVT